MTRLWLLILLLSLFIQLSVAEQLIFKNYHINDGLSNGMTTSCIQDKYGYIWIGTRDGLNRFNGYCFTVFRHDPHNPESVGADYITSLAIDNEENLWVATYQGIYRYYEEDERFELIPFTRNEYTTRLKADEKGNLWFFMNDTIWKYDIKNKTYTAYKHPCNNLFSAYCIKDGYIWAVDVDGILYQISIEKNALQSYDLFAGSPESVSKSISVVLPSAYSSALYLGSNGHGLLTFDMDSCKVKNVVYFKDNAVSVAIISMLEVDEDNLFVGTTVGMFHYSIKDKQYTLSRRNALNNHSLAGIRVNTLYKDRESGIWIGCYPGGISYYSPNRLFSVCYQQDIPGSMKGEVVRKIVDDKYGNIWLGMQDEGLNCFDPDTKQFINIPAGTNVGISQNNIPGLAVTGDTLWVGTFQEGIDLLHIPTKKVLKNYKFDRTKIRHPASEIVNMYVTRNKRVLVATNRGIYQYDHDQDKFVLYPDIPLLLNRIQCIHEDQEGILWIGMVNGGVYCYSRMENKGFYLDYDTVNTYGSKTVNDIYEDKNGLLWFATMDGLKQYDKRTKEVKQYHTEEGLSSNVIYCILPDENDDLWISTANGLVYFIKETQESRVYTEANGLITCQFNYNAARNKDGIHYMGTINGMVYYKPEEVRHYQNKLEISLLSVTFPWFGENNDLISLTGKTGKDLNVVLKPDQSTFFVNFSTFSYLTPRSTEYSFRLNNGNWSKPADRPMIPFIRLETGVYNLDIKARNQYSAWSDHIASLKITILPQWWRSPAAIYIYLLLSFCFTAFLVIYITKRNEKKLMHNARLLDAFKEKELYLAKIEFFTNIAHEIRTPLTLIKTPLDKILKKEHLSGSLQRSLELIEKNTNRLMDLVNQLLDFRKAEQENYHLNFVQVNIVALLENLINDFSQEIDDSGKLLNTDIPIPQLNVYADKEALSKILSNLMTNAIKYSYQLITIHLSVTGNYDQFNIDFVNDGTVLPFGLREKVFEPFYRGNEPASAPGSGLGLPLARSLAKMHNGSLQMVNTDSNMNTFRLSLPVNQPYAINLIKEDKHVETGKADETYTFIDNRAALLIVEDNKEMLHFIGHELNESYNIYTAENGKEGLSLLQSESIQLVITDIMMPVMDGLKMLEKIKLSTGSSHIPVILLTAKTTSQSKLEGLELKADAYIEKPFDMDLLIAQIANLLANRENIRDFYFHSPIANLKSTNHSRADEEFLNKLNGFINENISNPKLDVNLLAEMMNMSRSVLYRKIKAVSDRTPSDLIKITRLKKAAEILKTQDLKIYQVAEMVGFSSQAYFYYSFVKQFDISPSQYIKSQNGKHL